MDVGTTGGVAGAASTEEPAKLRIAVRCENERPEYKDNMQRVLNALSHVLEENLELTRAFHFLAQDSTFAIYVQGAVPKRIILPGAGVIK